MRLKNKKTGEVVDLLEGDLRALRCGEQIVVKPVAALNKEYIYSSLAELCEDWEDAPKEWWFIDNDGFIDRVTSYDRRIQMHRDCKEFGNYFETKEEAELAARKFKAWKRLKDNNIKLVTDGFDFEGDHNENVFGDINISIPRYEGVLEDLQTIFGGEE